MRTKLPLILVCLVSLFGLAQDADHTWLLKFAEYTVTDAEMFHGAPAVPDVVEEKHLTFRTAITDAAHRGPNFAGSYTVAQWDCGPHCTSFAVVDEATGKVFSAPFDILTTPLAEGTADEPAHEFKGVVFQLKSRLLIADGCPENKKCATYYYEWKSDKFRMLRMVPQRVPKRPLN